MKQFTLRQFMKACHGIYQGPSESLDRPIGNVQVDSRLIKKGDLFIATVGEKTDGHRFIPDVWQKSALCAVGQQKLSSPSGPYLLVEDTLKALKDAAESYRKSLAIPVIGITGSVGKTSTKEMVAAILSQKYQVLKTPGNFNNEIGLPLTVFKIESCHEAAVLEMGMNHFGEMHRLSKIARPTHCLFTNIGVAHLEYLGSRDGILKAKSEMFDYAAKDAEVFVNGDDDKLISLKNRAVTFGLTPANKVFADQVENMGLEGLRCRIHAGGVTFTAHIPLPGRHMVYNALAGTCIGLSLGLIPEEIQAGIRSLKPLDGRGNILHTGRYTLLDDCYNANPVSMCAMLDVLDHALTRKVAILGDMGELGEQSEALHASVGKHLGSIHADLVITIGPHSEALHKAAKSAAPWSVCMHYDSQEAFLEEADSLLQKGDSILLKASHYMGFEHIIKILSQENET